MKQINLIIDELRPRFDYLALPVVAAASAVLFALMLIAVLWAQTRLSALESENAQLTNQRAQTDVAIQDAEARIARNQLDPSLQIQINSLSKQIHFNQRALQLLGQGGDKISYYDIFAGLSRQATHDAWLLRFSISDDAIDLHGRVTDPSVLPKYLDKLNDDSAFIGKKFASLALVAQEGKADKKKENSNNPNAGTNADANANGDIDFLAPIGSTEIPTKAQVNADGKVVVPTIGQQTGALPKHPYAEFWLRSQAAGGKAS